MNAKAEIQDARVNKRARARARRGAGFRSTAQVRSNRRLLRRGQRESQEVPERAGGLSLPAQHGEEGRGRRLAGGGAAGVLGRVAELASLHEGFCEEAARLIKAGPGGVGQGQEKLYE